MSTREDGWYWVKHRVGHGLEDAWCIMLYSAGEWLVSGCEYPSYQDRELAEINEQRLKSPDEA